MWISNVVNHPSIQQTRQWFLIIYNWNKNENIESKYQKYCPIEIEMHLAIQVP